MDCLVCVSRPAYTPSLICGGCFARLKSDIATLVGAHTWLGIAMLNPTPAWKPGTIHRSPEPKLPFNAQLHDARVDIAGKLASWARVIAEEHVPALAGPADADPATVGRWLGHRLRWVSDQPWCDEMARELGELARAAYALVPWERHRRELPLPCPDCGYLTLTLYGGDELIVCRYRECAREMTWAEYWDRVRELQPEALIPVREIVEPEIKPPTSTGAAA